MKHRHHDFGRRPAAFVLIDRDATAIVDDRDRSVDVNRDRDVAAEPRQRLVDGVVHHLVHEVMKSRRTCRPDVHGRPLPDGLEAFKDLDFVSAVVVGSGRYTPAGVCQICIGHSKKDIGCLFLQIAT